jgi:hypothetical protein
VISVVTKTKPAKFIPTLSTGHVHAPLILFYVCFALGAWLRVQLYPERRIVFVEVDSVKPLLKEFTVDRLMGAFLT